MTTLRLPTTDVTDFGNAPGDGPLRPGGQSATLPLADQDLPSRPSAAVKAQAPALALVRDLWAGNERIHEESVTYLPRAPKEDAANYADRLARSVFFNFYRHTIEGLTGFVFRVDPELGDDVPPAIVDLWENIDNAGTHGAVFCRDLTNDARNAGHAAILVEYPRTGGTQTAADELAGAVRPYWVPVKKDDIVSWRTTVEDGRTLLTQLVLRERHMVPIGAFGEKPETLYRVFRRDDAGVVTFQLLYVSEDKRVLVVDEGAYPTQDEIPVAEVTTSGRIGLFESRPPLYDLGCLNIAHYQQWSDYATSIHKTCVPILFSAGFELDAAVVGPNTGINSADPAGKLEYVSHDGAALDKCKAALDDLVSQMANMGLAALASEKRTAETAKAKSIDKGAADSMLATDARGLQDALERALYFTARYMGLEEGGSIEVNQDFGDMTMAADLLTAYVGAVSNAGLPVRVLLEAMQKGNLLPEDTELDAVEAEVMANQAALEEQKQMEQQMRVDALRAAPAREPV